MSILNSDLSLGKIFSALKDVEGSIRFIGILGSGMYPLAKLLRGRGYTVSGYDRNAAGNTQTCVHVGDTGVSFAARECRSVNSGSAVPEECTDGSGIVFCPHTEVAWERISLAVYSLAIDESDPEILAATSHGVPLISRAQLLGALMSESQIRISVSGSHGKSTTTAAIEHILSLAGKNPTAVSGATLSSGEPYSDGGREVFVAEACEYKDSFLRLYPTHQIITSVELDHTDYFRSLEHIRSSFLSAASRAENVLINRDDETASGIADELMRDCAKSGRRVITYGKDSDSDYRISSIDRAGDVTRFSLTHGGKTLVLSTTLIGEFNIYNLACAAALADTLGIPDTDIASALSDFRPIDRRMSQISEIDGAPVFYDYAHHPTEIGAVIGALKERYGTLTVIFRPHTYSRTRSLWDDFIAELSKADFAILLDIYPAREKPIENINSNNLAKHIPRATRSAEADAANLALSYHTGAVALLGAGEVDRVQHDLIRLGKNKD